METYQLRQGHNGSVITKDGHTMFLADVMKGLKRMTWLEQQVSLSKKPGPVFALRQGNNGEFLTKDGHVMFLEDAVKGLNRMVLLEQQLQALRESPALPV